MSKRQDNATPGVKVETDNSRSRPRPQVVYNFEAIPKALRSKRRWVCWRYTYRNGKWTKVPVQPRIVDHAGKYGPYRDFDHARVNDPATWSSFAECVEAYTSYKDSRSQKFRLDGIGMVLAPEDGIVGIDLDKIINTDVDGEWAGPIIATAQGDGAFVEVSPSGTGVHVIGRGKLPEGLHGRRGGNCEVYSGERYLCMSGSLMPSVLPPGTPVAVVKRGLPNIQFVIDLALERIEAHDNGNDDKSRPSVSLSLAGMRQRVADYAAAHPLYCFEGSDDELVAAMMEASNGEATRALWSATDDRNPSEGDSSLLARIAWWAGPHPERVERIFWMSERTREKWDDREDYRERSVLRAILLLMQSGRFRANPTMVHARLSELAAHIGGAR